MPLQEFIGDQRCLAISSGGSKGPTIEANHEPLGVTYGSIEVLAIG